MKSFYLLLLTSSFSTMFTYFSFINLLINNVTAIQFGWDVLSWSSNPQNVHPFSPVHWMFFFFTGDSVVHIGYAYFSPQIVPSLSGSSLKSFQNLLPLSLPCSPTRNVKKNKQRGHSVFAALALSLIDTHKQMFSPVPQVDQKNNAC